MALVVADRVKVRTFTDGTSPFLIEGTFQGHQGFDAIGDGNETYYGIFDVAGNWEIGRGTYTASTSLLTRETIISSSNNNLIVNFPGGGKTLYSTLPSSVANSIITATVSDSFKNIAVNGQGTLVADSSTDTLTIVAGVGIGLSTNPGTDTLTINCTGDIKGSIFADDSTMLIDGTEGKIVGPIETTSLRTSEAKIALGLNAGGVNQGAGAISIGAFAGTNTAAGGIAIGYAAGTTNQGIAGVAVGYAAGSTDQAAAAVSVGYGAGSSNQGYSSVAIGYSAGTTDQAAQSIIINGSGAALENTVENSFVVKPVRNVSGTSILQYNNTTGEISHSNDIRSEGNINIEINLADSTTYRWQFGEDGNTEFPGNITAEGFIGTATENLRVESEQGKISLNSSKSDSLYTDAGGSYTSASWSGNNIDFTGVEDIYLETLLERFFNHFDGSGLPWHTGYSNITVRINDTQTLTVTGAEELGGGDWRVTVAETPASDPTAVTTAEFFYDFVSTLELDRNNNSYAIALDDSNFRINTRRDIRLESGDDIYIDGRSNMRLRNYSRTSGITIETDFNNSAYEWQFDEVGTLTTPGDITVAGDITGTSSSSTLVLKAEPSSNTYIQLNDTVDSTINTVANLEIRTDVANTAKTWTFGTDGSLTLPGDIKSETAINVDINLSDSTLRRWQFGEDGILTTPGSLSINSTFNFSTTGAGNQLASITVPSGGSLSIQADTSPVYFEGSSESNIVVIEDGDITANTVFATALNTQDSSALLVVPPVNFQTTITADQGIQLNGVDAIIRSDTSVRIVPTNSVESVGAELVITGLDVMGEPNVIIETATDQGTIQIGGDNNNTASVTVRKSTGEVYVGGFWRFLTDGGLYSGFLDAPPDSPTAGAFYVADGATWDPASKSGAVPYPVFWDGVSYHALY